MSAVPAPSLLDRQRAEEAAPLCTAQRALLTLFFAAAAMLFAVSTLSAPAPPHRIHSADLARSALKRRALVGHAAAAQASSSSLPHTTAADQLLLRPMSGAMELGTEAAPQLHPPPPSPAPAPAGVADATCHARMHTDYMGERAPVWGLGNPGFHLKDAAECCAACQAHAAVCGKPNAHSKSWWPARPELRCGNNPGCNIWVFCPEKQCFAFDIHVHTQGECWLKQQHANITRPKDPHEGHTSFPEAMRASPREVWPWAVDKKIWGGGIPEKVPWISGVLAPADATVVSARADDQWRKRWCDKHGPKYGGCDGRARGTVE